MGGTTKSLPPPNKKYANVKARLDTGCNELKIKGSDTKANARFHRGENFRRLKVRTLQQLLYLQQIVTALYHAPSGAILLAHDTLGLLQTLY